MLPGCFHLLDELPDTVYRVCDLIMTAIKRNGADYRDMILKQVVNQVSSQGTRGWEYLKVFSCLTKFSDKPYILPDMLALCLNSFACS